MSHELSLDGVRILVPHLYSGPIRSRMSTVLEPWQIERQLTGEALIPYAEMLGAVSVDDAEGDLDLFREGSADPNTFALCDSPKLMAEKDEEIRAGDHDNQIPRIPARAVLDCTDDELRKVPYVLSSVNEQGGAGKYLIERARQARRIIRAKAAGMFNREAGRTSGENLSQPPETATPRIGLL